MGTKIQRGRELSGLPLHSKPQPANRKTRDSGTGRRQKVKPDKPPEDPPGQLKKARREVLAALALMIETKKGMEPGHPSTPVEPTPSTPPAPTPPQLTPFFRHVPRQTVLKMEVEEWKGTPFRREAAGDGRKGVGADCVSFVEQALVNCGAIRPIEWPKYVCFGGGDAMLHLLLNTLRSIPDCVEIWKAQPGGPYPPLMVGDIFVRSIEHPKTKLVDYHHLALFIGDNTLIHMRQRKGLSKANIFDARALKKLQSIFRIHESAT